MLTLILLMFVVVISTIHELGHYSILKLFRVKNSKLSIGAGRKIYTRGDISVGWFPLTSFCTYDVEDLRSRALWVRLLMYLSGIFYNILAVVIAMIIIVGVYGFTSTSIESSTNEEFLRGDRILEVNEIPVFTWLDVRQETLKSLQQRSHATNYLVARDGATTMVILTNSEFMFQGIEFETRGYQVLRDMFVPLKFVSNYFGLAIESVQSLVLKADRFSTMPMGPPTSSEPVVKKTVVEKLLPVDILKTAPDASVKSALIIFVMLSIWLIICNLLPLPILDGGKALMEIVITVFKGKVNEDLVNAVSAIILVGIFICYLFL